MIEVSLIGQEVKIISPQIRLHHDMKRTIELHVSLMVIITPAPLLDTERQDNQWI